MIRYELYNGMNQTEFEFLARSKTSCKIKRAYENQSSVQNFKEKFKQMKMNNRIRQFMSNASRNNIYSTPVRFELKKKIIPLINIEGFQINRTLENIIILLDICFTLANFIISTFEAFLTGYQEFKKEHSLIFIVNILSVVVYTLSIVMSLTVRDIENGIRYNYILQIAKKQIIKGRFLIQLSFMVVIIITMVNTEANEYSERIGVAYFVLCIFKLYTLNFSVNKVQLLLINTLKKERYWNLIKVLMYNIFFAHFMASIFLAMLNINSERNWYQSKSNITPNPNWLQLYLWAYYWACTTMITVGFGDFIPVIVEEAIIVSALEILSSIIIAYNISQIGNIILSINQSNRVVNSKIGLLRRMNFENTVSPELNHIIEEYLVNQLAIEEEFEYSKHRELISNLPSQLQKKYYQESQKNIFRKLPFFVNLSSETLVHFFLQLTGKVYYPGEFIIQMGFAQEINIALKGELGYCYRRRGSALNGTVIETVAIDYSKNKPIFLAKNILNKNEGVYFDIKATKYSYGIKISYQSFINILKENQIDYHYYLMSLDIHQAQSSIAIAKCNNCSYDYHTQFECPKLHFIPFSTMVLAKYNQVQQKDKHQDRKFPNSIFRKEKEEHCYQLKQIMNSSILFRTEQFQYLTKTIQSFGNKRKVQKVYNKSVINLLKYKRFQCQDLDQEKQRNILQTLDVPCDFRHYFTHCNPDRLLEKPLQNLTRKVSNTLVSLYCQ